MIKLKLYKTLCVILFFQFIGLPILEAQNWKLNRYEAFGGISSFNYFGDIGGSASAENLYGIKDINLLNTRPTIYFGGRYYLYQRLSVQPVIYLGLATGSDKNSTNEKRGYKFTTPFVLPRLNLEFSFIHIPDLFGKRKSIILEYYKPRNKTFTMFSSSGVGYVFYKTLINDKMEQLKNQTDTLINPTHYIDLNKQNALVFNVGLGAKYFFVRSVAASVCIDFNTVLSDNFDGFVTQSNKNDVFWTVSIGLNYRIPTNEWGKLNISKKNFKTK